MYYEEREDGNIKANIWLVEVGSGLGSCSLQAASIQQLKRLLGWIYVAKRPHRAYCWLGYVYGPLCATDCG